MDILDHLLEFRPELTPSDYTTLDLYRPLLEASKTQEQRHDLERLILIGERVTDSLPMQYAAIDALLRIRTKAGLLAPLRPNRVQESFSSAPGARHIVLKARQMGMTTWIAATFFLFTITRPGTMTVLVAHDQRAAEEIFRIVHRFWTYLPEDLRAGVLRTSRCNVSQMILPALDSQFRIETAADADAGRGLTIQNLHASEVARWPGDPAETLATLRAAVTPQGRIVLESTPSGASGCFYHEWQHAPENAYHRHFFPWWWEGSYISEVRDDFADLTNEECTLTALHGLTREQIAFRRQVRRNYRYLAPQEFAEDAESCFLASGHCFFDAATIDARLKQLPEEDERRDLRIWLTPQPGFEYIIGADTSGGGIRGDYACAQVIHKATGLQCAELHGRWSTLEFAAELMDLGRIYNDALLVVESNNHGHGVLAHLHGNYPNVYETDRQVGFATTAGNRQPMLAQLDAVLTKRPESFNSRSLLQEMRTFVRKDGGRIEAAAGAYDDRVLAMAIANYVRTGQ